MATRAMKASRPGSSGKSEFPSNPSVIGNEEAIAVRAYELWQQRGSPFGSPQIDWLQAEEELNSQAQVPVGVVYLPEVRVL